MSVDDLQGWANFKAIQAELVRSSSSGPEEAPGQKLEALKEKMRIQDAALEKAFGIANELSSEIEAYDSLQEELSGAKKLYFQSLILGIKLNELQNSQMKSSFDTVSWNVFYDNLIEGNFPLEQWPNEISKQLSKLLTLTKKPTEAR